MRKPFPSSVVLFHFQIGIPNPGFKFPRRVIPFIKWILRLYSMAACYFGCLVWKIYVFLILSWRRKWQLTPVFLPGESQGREPGGLPSVGSHGVGHDWRDLAAAAAAEESGANKNKPIKYVGWMVSKWTQNSFTSRHVDKSFMKDVKKIKSWNYLEVCWDFKSSLLQFRHQTYGHS